MNVVSSIVPLNSGLVINVSWAGHYWIGGANNGFGIALKNKPNAFHRFMMRVAFGWVWQSC